MVLKYFNNCKIFLISTFCKLLFSITEVIGARVCRRSREEEEKVKSMMEMWWKISKLIHKENAMKMELFFYYKIVPHFNSLMEDVLNDKMSG